MESIKHCDVCGKDVKIDKWGNGKCENCGWCNDANSIIYSDAVNPPNFISLNEAKNYYKNKIKYKPTFDRILQLVNRGFDIVIKYKKTLYQLSKHDDFTIWQVDTQNYQAYSSLEEFKNNVKIDNVSLTDLWKSINYIKYDC